MSLSHLHLKAATCVAIAGLLVASGAWAAAPPRYRIVQGQGYAACEAFLKNLNALPADDPPMVCELKLRARQPQFTRPAWQELDVSKHLPLAYEAESLLWIFTPIGERPKPFAEWQTTYETRIAASRTGPPRLRKAELDLNGKGLETLIWYEAPWTESCVDLVEQTNSMSPLTSLGGYLFVQQKAEGKLRRIAGTIAQGRAEVVLDGAQRPWFVTANMDVVRSANDPKPVWEIGLHAVSKDSPAGDYFVPRQCVYHADR